MAGWRSDNDIVSDAGGVGFHSQAGQIGHSVAMTRYRCDISSEFKPVSPRRCGDGSRHPLHASA